MARVACPGVPAVNRKHLTGFHLRPGRLEDLPALAHIEREAAALFPEETLPSGPVAGRGHDPIYASCVTSCLWVAEHLNGEIIGFAAAGVYGRSLHVEEMDVMPAQGRKGVGTALLQHVLRVAWARGHSHVTLTTFAHLAWNAPFYATHGFVRVADFGAYPHLAKVLREEENLGLRQRIAMVRTAPDPLL